MRFQLALAFTALAAAAVRADTTTLQIKDANNFCTFLPPTSSENRNIADTEYIAEAFCMGSTPEAHSAGTLASGFVLSAHYLATDDYVQVTGQIDPVKMNLNATDEGGQYDIVMPKGAICAGWKHFVNLIEPLGHTYCVRCCHSKPFCNRGISEKGCSHIIPGDYSGPYDGSGGPLATTTTAAIPSPASSPAADASGSKTPSSSPAASSSSVPANSSSSAAASGSASGASGSASANASDSVIAQSVDGKSGAAAIRPTFIAIGALLVSIGLLA